MVLGIILQLALLRCSKRMSGEKRPAQDAFGSSQLVVKRQKSDASLNASAVTLRPGQNGAVVQAVSISRLFDTF